LISFSEIDIVYKKEKSLDSVGKISVKLPSDPGKEFSQKITIGEDEYIITTEDFGPSKPVLTTRVYYKGQIISSFEFDYSDVLNHSDLETLLTETTRKQHEEAIKSLKRDKISREKTYEEYISAVESIMRNRKPKEAFALLMKAREQYPNNPFIFSYQGYLDTMVNRNFSRGIKTCREAFTILREQVPFGEEFLYPVLYLNLGKAYLAAGRKKEAHIAFMKGLEIDAEHRELLRELKKIGERKNLPLPFLERSNPLNKFLGRLFYAFKDKGSKR
jgi:tetratricopeptide (TPR) repeat protein